MITVEIINELAELKKYVLEYKGERNSPGKSNGKKQDIISEEYEDIIKLMTANDRNKWFVIKYYGEGSNVKKELSIIKINEYENYFVDISAAEPSMLEVGEIQKQLIELEKSKNATCVIAITKDGNIPEGKVEVLLIVPDYEMGWQLNRMLDKKGK